MDHERRLSFGEHLEELRLTIFLCLLSIFVAAAACFVLREEILAIVLVPVQRLGLQLQTIQVTEPFIVALKLAGLGGLMLASPFVSHFLWEFVGSGLYPHERRIVRMYAPFSVGLFLLGVLFCYVFVLPTGLGFLTTFLDSAWIVNGIQLSSYLSFFLLLNVAIGLSFELPLVMLVLQRVGLVNPEQLRRYRRHAVLIAFVAAALFTPPDPVTQIFLGSAVVILYEVGIWLGVWTTRKSTAVELTEA